MTTTDAGDTERLLALLDVHESAVADLLDVVRELEPGEWTLPTDLPGWCVADVVAHVAHLEAVLAGTPEEIVEVPADLSHVRSPMGSYTEQGVIARRGRSQDALVEEIATSVAQRHQAIRADPPTDGGEVPPLTPGGIGWSWRVLLSNRPLDVVMHEQDLRRAVGRPGNLDSVGARHVVEVFASGLGFVLAKRAGAGPGTTVAVELTDSGRRYAATVGDDKRGRRADPDATADATLTLDTETFLVLCGGRGDADEAVVTTSGDVDLAARVVAGLAQTP